MNICYFLALLGVLIQGAFIYIEHQKNYKAALILKTSASFFFCLIGLIAYNTNKTATGLLLLFGLIFGMCGDFFLNLRFLSEKNGQKIFLVGIAFFLIGHIIYLCAIIPFSSNLLICVLIGALLAAGLLAYIFKTMEVAAAFKAFGILYLGAIIIMTSIAIGNFLTIGNTFTKLYAAGAIFFTISDIVLIFNTFSGSSRFSRRIINLSFYYLGQLLIAFSIFHL